MVRIFQDFVRVSVTGYFRFFEESSMRFLLVIFIILQKGVVKHIFQASSTFLESRKSILKCTFLPNHPEINTVLLPIPLTMFLTFCAAP